MKTLLLKFAGPLQSWGVGSHFEKRHTGRYPSKSAVLGILAACLGYRRDEDEKIRKLNELQFAVRIDQPGHILRDYQTAHKYKENGKFKGTYKTDCYYPVIDKQDGFVYQLDRTYVTERYYLEDAVFVAAIGSRDDTWIDQIEDALKNPYFQPYLGRRSLPVTYDVLLGTRNDDVISSLREVPWQASPWYQRQHKAHLEIFADAGMIETGQISYRKDRLISFSGRDRQHGFRSEGRIVVDLNQKYTMIREHDAFGALED